jgi:hypothetical protein
MTLLRPLCKEEESSGSADADALDAAAPGSRQERVTFSDDGAVPVN